MFSFKWTFYSRLSPGGERLHEAAVGKGLMNRVDGLHLH